MTHRKDSLADGANNPVGFTILITVKPNSEITFSPPRSTIYFILLFVIIATEIKRLLKEDGSLDREYEQSNKSGPLRWVKGLT